MLHFINPHGDICPLHSIHSDYLGTAAATSQRLETISMSEASSWVKGNDRRKNNSNKQTHTVYSCIQFYILVHTVMLMDLFPCISAL